jgi:diguanylate cyclase (GGDEF)-like protein
MSQLQGQDNSLPLDNPNLIQPMISDVALKIALEQIVYNALRSVLIGLTLLYLLLAVSHCLVLPKAMVLPMMTVALTTAAIFGGLYLCFNKFPPALRWTYFIGFTIAFFALSNSLLHLYLSKQPFQTTNLILLLLGASLFILSERWFVLILTVTLIGWISTVWYMEVTAEIWQHYGFALFMGAILATVVNYVQIRNMGRLERWRLTSEQQTARLESEVIERKAAETKLRQNKGELETQVRERTAALEREIVERKSYAAQLEHLVAHDSLTQLPNRNLLKDRLKQAIAHAHRSNGLVAVLFLDLDRFKLVNDSLGHRAGDLLLQEIAKRLTFSVRKEDTVARLGGDEFVMVLQGLAHSEQAALVARKVLEQIRQPVALDKQEFYVNCSIGISLFPKDGKNVSALLKHADIALHRVKEQGRNNLQFYTNEMNTRFNERLKLAHDLRQALESDQLNLHYQPQIELRSGRVVGVEALLRWQHPQLGAIPPTQFVPLAEENGLIVPIGEWVLRTACDQAKAWRDMNLSDLRMSVNLSARQFMQVNLLDQVYKILRETTSHPLHLELEITESLLMTDVKEAIKILQAFKAIGVCIAIDDFGTGYTSLSYLQRLPVDRLKIDRSFVQAIALDSDVAAIALAIITMAHSLQLKVIAEGVENKTQINFLKTNRCDEIQGYYFCPPQSSKKMTALLSDRRTLGLQPGIVEGRNTT